MKEQRIEGSPGGRRCVGAATPASYAQKGASFCTIVASSNIAPPAAEWWWKSLRDAVAEPGIVRLGREAEGEDDGPGRLTRSTQPVALPSVCGRVRRWRSDGEIVHRAVALDGASLQSETVGQHGDGDGSDAHVDGVKEDPVGRMGGRIAASAPAADGRAPR